MTTLEFLSHRKTKSLKECDYVYYLNVSGWSNCGLPKTEILLGQVIGVDDFDVDVEPFTNGDDFICHTVQISDCRKVTKKEMAAL